MIVQVLDPTPHHVLVRFEDANGAAKIYALDPSGIDFKAGTYVEQSCKDTVRIEEGVH